MKLPICLLLEFIYLQWMMWEMKFVALYLQSKWTCRKWNIDYKWSTRVFVHKPWKKFVPNMSSYIFQTLCTTWIKDVTSVVLCGNKKRKSKNHPPIPVIQKALGKNRRLYGRFFDSFKKNWDRALWSTRRSSMSSLVFALKHIIFIEKRFRNRTQEVL
jgi:hypothetical protein